MEPYDQIILIVAGCLVFILLLGSNLYRARNRKLAILEKPDNGDVYKVFEVTIDNTVYYIIKHYIYIRETSSHLWNLFANYSYYKNMSKDEVIELCARLNTEHKNMLHEKKMTNELGSIVGKRIN